MRSLFAAGLVGLVFALGCGKSGGPREPGQPMSPALSACLAGFELAVKGASERAGEPGTLLLEGRGACEEVSGKLAARMQSQGLDVWPWSGMFGPDAPRCPSPQCGPAGGASRLTVDLLPEPARCPAEERAGDDGEGPVRTSGGARHVLSTPCGTEGAPCARLRVRELRHGGGHDRTVVLSCESGRHVAYESLDGAVVY